MDQDNALEVIRHLWPSNFTGRWEEDKNISNVRLLWPSVREVREIRGPYLIHQMWYGVHPFWSLPRNIVGEIAAYVGPPPEWEALWSTWYEWDIPD